MTDQFFKIKNFEKFQHYPEGSRNVLWIKLYLSTLDDFEFNRMPELCQLHAMKLWLLAARVGNYLPYDEGEIKVAIKAKRGVRLDKLLEFGFILLADGYQDASLDQIRLDKKREDQHLDHGTTPQDRGESVGFLREWGVEEKLISELEKRPDLDALVHYVRNRDVLDPPRYIVSIVIRDPDIDFRTYRSWKKHCAVVANQAETSRQAKAKAAQGVENEKADKEVVEREERLDGAYNALPSDDRDSILRTAASAQLSRANADRGIKTPIMVIIREIMEERGDQ